MLYLYDGMAVPFSIDAYGRCHEVNQLKGTMVNRNGSRFVGAYA
ncbi:hypothetical protein [Halalkalibacter sp. APA_J-10(15)]|nr:hypothetical protein [Halalkalibacter sp. APA_J-10(15)]